MQFLRSANIPSNVDAYLSIVSRMAENEREVEVYQSFKTRYNVECNARDSIRTHGLVRCECIDRNSRHTTEARLATAARRRFDNVAVCCIVLRAHKRYRIRDRNASPREETSTPRGGASIKIHWWQIHSSCVHFVSRRHLFYYITESYNYYHINKIKFLFISLCFAQFFFYIQSRRIAAKINASQIFAFEMHSRILTILMSPSYYRNCKRNCKP